MSRLSMTRRRWMTTSALAAAAATARLDFLPVKAAEVDLTKLPYIDAHSHVWSRDVMKWPLANAKTKDDLKPSSFTPEELFKLAEPEGVGRVVLIQHTVYHGWDNTYLIDCAKRFAGRFAVVGMVDDSQPQPGERMRELLPQGVRGLRITPRNRDNWLEGEGMNALWRMGGETKQAMCCLIDAKYLPSVAAMCQKHPVTPVVIDHFARIGVDGTFHEADIANLCGLAKHKHVHVKLSAYYALGNKKPPHDELAPMIRRLLDAFSVERCMWVSDSPYQVQPPNSYQASISLIRDRLSGLSAGDKQWLLAKSAEKVYFA